MKHTIILYDLRSAHNVGSIFRTADAVGIDSLFLVGTTPTPTDRFGRAQKDIAKTALGAEKSISWRYFQSIEEVFKNSNEYYFVAVEQSKDAINYKEFKPASDTAFVFGNEVEGISNKVLDKVDKIIEVPMHGAKESLNVSVAVGVVLFEVLD